MSSEAGLLAQDGWVAHRDAPDRTIAHLEWATPRLAKWRLSSSPEQPCSCRTSNSSSDYRTGS